jgi:hypothetical protein
VKSKIVPPNQNDRLVSNLFKKVSSYWIVEEVEVTKEEYDKYNKYNQNKSERSLT